MKKHYIISYMWIILYYKTWADKLEFTENKD